MAKRHRADWAAKADRWLRFITQLAIAASAVAQFIHTSRP